MIFIFSSGEIVVARGFLKILKILYMITDIIIKALHDGVQTIVFFGNGYGASVIKHRCSYGYDEGLFEIAIIKGNRKEWHINYDTPITDDVLGYQTSEDIDKVLKQIEKL